MAETDNSEKPRKKAKSKTTSKAKSKAPAKAESKAPAKAESEAPSKVKSKVPAKAESEAPAAKAKSETPSKVKSKAPAKAESEAPAAKAKSEAPSKVKSKVPAKAESEAPAAKAKPKTPPAKTKAKAPARRSAASKTPKTRFKPRTIDEIRRRLLEERAKYLHSAEEYRAEADSLLETREPGDVQFDEEGGEGGSLAVERERDIALSNQARETVELIDAALERIDNGTYGYCQTSGDPIPLARLRAIPWASQRVEVKAGGLGRR